MLTDEQVETLKARYREQANKLKSEASRLEDKGMLIQSTATLFESFCWRQAADWLDSANREAQTCNS